MQGRVTIGHSCQNFHWLLAATGLLAEFGNYARQQLAADLTGPIDEGGRWLYRFVGVYRDTGTQVDYVDENAVVLAPSLTWRPTDASQITLLANYQKTDSDTGAQFIPIAGSLLPAPNGEFFDPDVYLGEPTFNRYNTETRSLSLLADHQLNDVFSIEATERITDGEADYRQAWPAFIGGNRFVSNPDSSLYEGGRIPRTFYLSDAISEQHAIDVRVRAAIPTGPFDHEILMGAQYQQVTTDNDSSYNYAMGYDFSADPANWDDRFWINPFDPVYGSVPDASELLPLTDAPLKPREGRQYEVGIKYQFPHSPAWLTLAWFDIRQSNLPNPNSLPSAPSQQEGVARIDGYELAGLMAIGDVTVDASVSALGTRNPNGFRLASVPDRQASAWLSWRPGGAQGFRAGLGIRYVGVLANTQVRSRKAPRIQPAEAGARSLPAVFRHLALFAGTVPAAALTSALLAMAVAQLLPLDVVDRMAFAVLAVPVLWGLLAWWMCSDVRLLRPAAGVAVIVASCALFLYVSSSAS